MVANFVSPVTILAAFLIFCPIHLLLGWKARIFFLNIFVSVFFMHFERHFAY